jgi:invasion protein IalB
MQMIAAAAAAAAACCLQTPAATNMAAIGKWQSQCQQQHNQAVSVVTTLSRQKHN